ncbi:MAG: serine/threonine protein kinase, partial [Myxococcales bacterium]|nr:serine/threonine protein kinase [Myxococcales bacterium]
MKATNPAPEAVRGPIGRLGRYAVLGRWSGGGMAEIYLGRQIGMQGFQKLVALKVLRSEFADDPEFREMFFSEARTAGLLSHPNIIQTFDAAEAAGQVYMAMEFVHGEPLGQLIRHLRKEEGGFSQPLALEIARATASALHYAHTLEDLEGRNLSLVHRDVSPSNIMVTHQGEV